MHVIRDICVCVCVCAMRVIRVRSERCVVTCDRTSVIRFCSLVTGVIRVVISYLCVHLCVL